MRESDWRDEQAQRDAARAYGPRTEDIDGALQSLCRDTERLYRRRQRNVQGWMGLAILVLLCLWTGILIGVLIS